MFVLVWNPSSKFIKNTINQKTQIANFSKIIYNSVVSPTYFGNIQHHNSDSDLHYDIVELT